MSFNENVAPYGMATALGSTRSRERDWEGEAFVTYGAVLVLHDGLRKQSMHVHRPFELVCAIDGRVRYKTSTGSVVETEVAFFPPMQPHALLGCDGRLARIYLDPGLRRATTWKGDTVSREDGSHDALIATIRSFFESPRSIGKARALIDEWRLSWIGDDDVAQCDPRVVRVLRHLDDDAALDTDRAAMARLAGLSPSRFAAIFAEDTGMPLRQYLRWRRVLIAARLIREGQTITEAALEAGFADHAHLSRSYREAFGLPPRSLIDLKIGQRTSGRHRS